MGLHAGCAVEVDTLARFASRSVPSDADCRLAVSLWRGRNLSHDSGSACHCTASCPRHRCRRRKGMVQQGLAAQTRAVRLSKGVQVSNASYGEAKRKGKRRTGYQDTFIRVKTARPASAGVMSLTICHAAPH